MSIANADALLAVAAAIFDSLWEGALIVGAIWLALRCLPAVGAATRYAIWLCALAGLVVIPLLTVGLAAQSSPPANDAPPVPQRLSMSVTPALQQPVAASPAVSAPATASAEPAAPAPRKARISLPQGFVVAIAAIWILAACARAVLLLLDVRALAAVRRDARPWSTADGYPILLSDCLQVPLAAGFVRAAVILPAALVERLSADAVRTIVIHEVAHLRRYDVWTNGLARIAQVFVALNPAAWFVLRRLALEREIACDDWVVARTGAGDAFARALATLATSAGTRMPLAAPSALGSRHSIVVRIERLLDARPRRLRLSPPALGGAFMLLALIAFTLQSVSPDLAYAATPNVLAQSSTAAPGASTCPVPNRGIMMSYLLGPKRRAKLSGADNKPVADASAVVARVGADHAVVFDFTVDASGRPRDVVLRSHRYPDMERTVTHIVMASTFEPALHDCVPVTTTVRTAFPVDTPEVTTASLIVPTYPAGWSEQHPSACKVPQITRVRFRPGYVRPNSYTEMLPAFPDSMKNIAVGSKFTTLLRAHVNAAGAATSVSLTSSSGKPAFDDAALTAARHATYPLVATSCKPLPADYKWQTTFERNSLLFRLGAAAAKPAP